MDKQSKAIFNSPVVRMNESGEVTTNPDQIAVEEPLEIRLGNDPFIVTMRTPGHDEELAAGFLASEGIIRGPGDIKAMTRCSTASTPENTIRIDLSQKVRERSRNASRHGAVTASCGICGKTSIEAIHNHFSPIKSQKRISRATLLSLPERLQEAQRIFRQTGGLHSAGLFSLDGALLALREDVGRHNAVDKVLGYALLNQLWPLEEQLLLVSGRVAFEIMQKALSGRLSLVAAVSAPSSLAIQFALANGQTLVGFLRPPSFNVYAHPQRIG